MKQYFLLAISAIAVLSACTKTNPIDNTGDQEISYQLVSTNMATKATSEYSGTFQSWAFYLASGNWSYGTSSAQPYITDVTISKVGTTWKNATTSYYWPKNGSLTFFALAPSTLPTGATKTCTAAAGIGVSGFSASNTYASQVDLMVADIKADQTANTSTTYYTTGVPTLFRHKLTKVAVSACTAEDYGTKYAVTITGISLKGVKSTGSYVQNPEAWTVSSTTKDYTFTAPSGTLTTTPAVSTESYYMIPQLYTNMGDAKLVVEYSISMAGSSTITVTGTKEIALATETTTSWGMNKSLVYKLTFSPDEILWDPAVEDWDTTSNVNVSL